MAKKATRLEDIGDERDQAVFMATVKVWFDGDLQAALDQAVFAAYGWPDDLTDEQILERLLELNMERAKAGGIND